MRNLIKGITATTIFLGLGAGGVYSTVALETGVSVRNAENVDNGLCNVDRASLKEDAELKNGKSARDTSLVQVQKAAKAFRESEEKVIENFDSNHCSFDELKDAVQIIIKSSPTDADKEVLYDLYEAMMDYGDLCNSDPEVVSRRSDSKSVRKFREVLLMIIRME